MIITCYAGFNRLKLDTTNCMRKISFQCTQNDIDLLALHKKNDVNEETTSFDYLNKVVSKPWGYEYVLYEQLDFSAWLLCLEVNSSTSLHCHPNKDTVLILLSGELQIETLGGVEYMRRGDSALIEKGVFHKSINVYDKPIYMIEIETPKCKNDLVRAKDNYGRENTGYEKPESYYASEMIVDHVKNTSKNGFSTQSFEGIEIAFYNRKIIRPSKSFDIIVPLGLAILKSSNIRKPYLEPIYSVNELDARVFDHDCELFLGINIA